MLPMASWSLGRAGLPPTCGGAVVSDVFKDRLFMFRERLLNSVGFWVGASREFGSGGIARPSRGVRGPFPREPGIGGLRRGGGADIEG